MKYKIVRNYPMKHIDSSKYIDVEESLISKGTKVGKVTQGAVRLFVTLKAYSNEIINIYDLNKETPDEIDNYLSELCRIGLIRVTPAVIAGDAKTKIIYLQNPDEVLTKE